MENEGILCSVHKVLRSETAQLIVEDSVLIALGECDLICDLFIVINFYFKDVYSFLFCMLIYGKCIHVQLLSYIRYSSHNGKWRFDSIRTLTIMF